MVAPEERAGTAAMGFDTVVELGEVLWLAVTFLEADTNGLRKILQVRKRDTVQIQFSQRAHRKARAYLRISQAGEMLRRLRIPWNFGNFSKPYRPLDSISVLLPDHKIPIHQLRYDQANGLDSTVLMTQRLSRIRGMKA
jgi:hypothetical protein